MMHPVIASAMDMATQCQPKSSRIIGGLTTDQISSLSNNVCSQCKFGALCNVRRNRFDANYRIPLVECRVVADYLVLHPFKEEACLQS